MPAMLISKDDRYPTRLSTKGSHPLRLSILKPTRYLITHIAPAPGDIGIQCGRRERSVILPQLRYQSCLSVATNEFQATSL